jgi:glycosyltransferase involved in cell wall biosynthesis
LRRFHDGRRVLVTGWVSEVEPYLTHAALSVAPLRVAAGMQNKVLRALGLGVPVVATPQALAWMPHGGMEGVIVAGDATAFAAETVRGLLKPSAARAAARKGKKFVLGRYRWKESGKKLEDILRKAAQDGRGK